MSATTYSSSAGVKGWEGKAKAINATPSTHRPRTTFGPCSSIHDHHNSHCFMKILDGELKETRYSWPAKTGGEILPMEETGELNMKTDDVAYMSGKSSLTPFSSLLSPTPFHSPPFPFPPRCPSLSFVL